MASERKTLEAVSDWIVSCGSTQYGSIFAVCSAEEAAFYSADLVRRYSEAHPGKSAVCISAADYAGDFIQAVRDSAVKEYSRRFLDADLLVLTGIEEISAKARTEQELYATVDKLFEKQKQVVFFSAVLPRDIPGVGAGNLAQFEESLVIRL